MDLADTIDLPLDVCTIILQYLSWSSFEYHDRQILPGDNPIHDSLHSVITTGCLLKNVTPIGIWKQETLELKMLVRKYSFNYCGKLHGKYIEYYDQKLPRIIAFFNDGNLVRWGKNEVNETVDSIENKIMKFKVYVFMNKLNF